ncbi:MAG: prenyltransferase/squalene oxidase repeat-containing protein, partial [Terriglobia bacterium]
MRVVEYLRGRQLPSGLIENEGVSAWSVIALGAAGYNPQTARDGNGPSLLRALAGYKPVSATDYARQTLAVIAAGEDPSHYAGRDLVGGLWDFVRGNQIGEDYLLNDDVFGLLALVAAGGDVSNDRLEAVALNILSHQHPDGGFSFEADAEEPDVDDTAAAVQALLFAKGRGMGLDLRLAMLAAESYLRRAQNSDGGFPYQRDAFDGFSNTASTSWAVQAFLALGIDPESVVSGGSDPLGYLAGLQNDDGSFGWAG